MPEISCIGGSTRAPLRVHFFSKKLHICHRFDEKIDPLF